MLRIAHFTDVHVTEFPERIPWSSLFSKRFLGWVNLKFLGRCDTFRDASKIAEAFVDDVLQVAPDVFLSTGDFTGIALPSEYEGARRALDKLFEAKVDVTTIPGNHDFYVRSAVTGRLFEKTFDPWIRTDVVRDEFPESLRDEYPYPLVRLFGDDVAVIMLRDARPALPHDSSGLVGPRQRKLLEHFLQDERVASRTRILALHYGLRRADGSPDKLHHRLRDAEEVFRIAETAGVDLVIHGHLHRRFIHPGGTLSQLAISNPGSLTADYGDRTYHVYTIEGGRIRLEARRFDAESGVFQPWLDAPGVGDLTPVTAETSS